MNILLQWLNKPRLKDTALICAYINKIEIDQVSKVLFLSKLQFRHISGFGKWAQLKFFFTTYHFYVCKYDLVFVDLYQLRNSQAEACIYWFSPGHTRSMQAATTQYMHHVHHLWL